MIQNSKQAWAEEKIENFCVVLSPHPSHESMTSILSSVIVRICTDFESSDGLY